MVPKPSLVAEVMLIRHLCCQQNPVLWDECGNRSRGGQSGDHAARPGDEEDGAMRRQAARRTRQWERINETFRRAAQWEEMCMLDKEVNEKESVLGCFFFPSCHVLSLFLHLFYCMFIYLLMLSPSRLKTPLKFFFFSFLKSLAR